MNWKIAFGVILFCISAVILILIIVTGVREYNDFQNNYNGYWELADRSSTLEAKQQYMDKFVNALEDNRDKFADNNAMWLKTPQNSFENNLQAVKTLRDRLIVIQSMNESSFEYQTAIQQITAQEQGEAQDMIDDIEGCFAKQSYPIIWGFYMILEVLLIFVLSIIGMMSLASGLEDSY